MKVSAILAIGKDGEIGLNGGLPWKSKGDLQHFKNITSGHCVLMGFNTYLSIGKPLPNRKNIVISFEKKEIDGCHCFKTVEDGIDFAKQNGEDELFIIGGLSIYKYCNENNLIDRFYITHMVY